MLTSAENNMQQLVAMENHSNINRIKNQTNQAPNERLSKTTIHICTAG